MYIVPVERTGCGANTGLPRFVRRDRIRLLCSGLLGGGQRYGSSCAGRLTGPPGSNTVSAFVAPAPSPVRLRPRHIGIAVLAFALSACHLVPDDVSDPARGAGVATALHVRSLALDLAADHGASQPAGCRTQAFDHGPVAVETTLTWTRKAPGVPPQRIVESRRFERDAAGDASAFRSVAFSLQDGRRTTRSAEERWVDGRGYSALDGRFADAARLPELGRRVDAAAFEAVDALLSVVKRGEGGDLAPADGDGFCRAQQVAGLEPIHAAFVEWSAGGRRGWLEWRDLPADMHLILTFEERVRPFDGDVAAPDTLWEVDPDRSWSRAQAFLEEGRRAGWLRPPRVTSDAP